MENPALTILYNFRLTLHVAKSAKKKPAKKTRPRKNTRKRPLRQRLSRLFWRWLYRIGFSFIAVTLLVISLFAFVNPPTTPYMFSEGRRLGAVDQAWVALENISPYMARSAVAAEDAGFCQHWGFDVKAIRAAIEGGGARGGSTISQQVVKNVFLWQGRSWFRKALEALLTPVLEAVWSKRRIIEVYLNVAEFDKGVFGVESASWHYFKVGPDELTPLQAARLAAVLPNPKHRSASKPGPRLQKRATSIVDGAATIRKDGRSACFEG
jgi:monofunctional biosynthetic peptidoglycan transglycosylase